MKTIRFTRKDNAAFTATLRKNVNNYFKENDIAKQGDWRNGVKAAVMLGSYLIPLIMILTIPMNPWLMLPLVLLMGAGIAGTGMAVMHDAAHESTSRKKWVNKLLSASMYLLGGNVFNWKIQHNVMHHTFTNVDGYDEDIQSRVVIRLSKHAPLRWIHRFQYVYAFGLYSFMTLAMVTKDFKQLIQYNKAGITRQHNKKPVFEILKLVLFKLLYLFIIIGLPLLLTNLVWWQVMIGFLLMHMTAGILMSTVFQMAHLVEGTKQPLPDDNSNIENVWTIHQLETTSNFARNNKFLSWAVGGLNFQIEHHLFPNINHVHYPALSPIVESTAKAFGLPYNLKPSFTNALGSHVRTLKLLGK